jgi:hypothetical protein
VAAFVPKAFEFFVEANNFVAFMDVVDQLSNEPSAIAILYSHFGG